ncbi:GNAT superfamily N-acetyltransferase [Paenibacillus sp. 1182]|uniref:GNAT family N-acetyltransferase n=2 Tax=unclassified Paenibacillus TaxID=185978 RepID=UPI000FB9D824|nr:GNAT family N-acetyltransferase [Paenibacillus sp. 1182]MBP1308649.1 GNAT superfamily N-acetyltransferase [Paenibacillus sp. 1182]
MCAHHMIQGMELAESYFYKAFGLFDTMKHHISIQGVISGIIPGRIFLSNDGNTAVLSNPQGIFLGGSPDNKAFFKEINMLLQEILLPQLAFKGKLDYVLYYPADEKWEAALETVMKDVRPMKSGRMTFTQHLDGIASPLGEDIVAIDRELLKQRHLAGLEDIIHEILDGWPSQAAYEKNGFGCAAIQHTEEGPAIVSWCLTDWVVGQECELGIQTVASYQKKGWARKVALGALSLAKQRGIDSVGWQCWSDNIASQRTALSVGFTVLADFPVLFGWNLPLNNLLVNGNYYMHGNIEYGVAPDYARSAWSYAQALDQGWDWSGDAGLYWNAACMFYLTGEQKRARHYYQKAIEKGWIDIHQPHYHDFIYKEANSEQIARTLAESIE